MTSAGTRLRDLISTSPVIAPTAYDMVAARLIVKAGFPAVFCSGYGQSASALGLPDRGLISLYVLEARVAAMTRTVSVPVIADADTGFEDPAATVRRLSDAGAAAIMLEDQVPDKQCGHISGKRVIPTDVMERRLNEALRSRAGEVLLIARTDAREPLGLKEALRRARLYAELGADIVFVEAPESVEELAAIPSAVPCSAMVNMVPGGRTPSLSISELAELGFRLIVFGLLDLMVAGAAVRRAFAELREGGDWNPSRSRCSVSMKSMG